MSPRQPTKFSYLDKSRMQHGGLLNKHMSRVMRKPTFYICENKDADQLRGNWNGGPEGWDFPISLYTNDRFYFSHI